MNIPVGESSETPLAYGPSARGRLRQFANRMGALTLNDLPKPINISWDQFSQQTLDASAISGRPVLFDLTQMQDIQGVLTGTGAYSNTITAFELRYIQQNWSRFQSNVSFYMNDIEIGKPW